MKYNYSQNNWVKFAIGDIHGVAQVCGVTNVAMPVRGPTYIIRPEPPLNTPDYPFTHIACPVAWLLHGHIPMVKSWYICPF
ncbi:MAG: hypothetical protein WCO84_06390 [bacterium]